MTLNSENLVCISTDPASLTALDLAAEAAAAAASGESVHVAIYQNQNTQNDNIQVLLIDEARCGIAWGSDAVWVDAESIPDGLITWSQHTRD